MQNKGPPQQTNECEMARKPKSRSARKILSQVF